MKILEPIRIKDIQFQNRVVMAPMVPFGMPELTTGVMSGTLLRHYLERATNGMGLMISQSLSVTARRPAAGGTGIWNDEHIQSLRDIASACHERKTKLFVQLAYPSAGHQNGESVNHLMVDELTVITEEFVKAAFRCKVAGCDGVELHGAHGYFLNMFASPTSNKRSDIYGGDLEGRLYLARNIINGIRAFADDNFIISYRMGWNDDLETDIQTARALETIGVDMLHVSSGIPLDRSVEISDGFPFNAVVFAGTRLKRHVSIPVVVVNDIQTLNRGNALLENGLCDFVAFGRPFLADPFFFTNSLLDNEHHPCLRCKTCQWFTKYDRCPALRKNMKE